MNPEKFQKNINFNVSGSKPKSQTIKNPKLSNLLHSIISTPQKSFLNEKIKLYFIPKASKRSLHFQ